MNLADAIRQAAQTSGLKLVQGDEETPQAVELPTFGPEATPQPTIEGKPRPQGSQAVRFELSLTPEQLEALLKGVVKAQHSVMTTREAAKYLRVPAASLESMAQTGQIPAFLIDGKWRFSRNGLDEWLSKQSLRKEMEA